MKFTTCKKTLAMIVIATILLSILACLPVSAAATPQIERDGLVAWYDGSNNSNGEQDFNTTTWRDLSGNRNHLQVRLNETNYWTDNAFHIDSASYYFPDAIKDVVNSKTYTIEFVAGELQFGATNWITLMCSDNDELSIFVRVPNGSDTDTNFEYKYNDLNEDRPKIDNGAEVINNATVTITFDLTDPEFGECIVYINGEALGYGEPKHTNIADTVSFGHEDSRRVWSGDIHGFRFYDRALSAWEVQSNAEADQEKYRSGNHYAPEQEYDDSDEDIAQGLTGDFKNNIIPITEELDIVPTEGYYGGASIVRDNVYNKEEWNGVRVARTEALELDSGGIELNPSFYVNYQKYCRRAGLTAMSAETVKYVVTKVKAEGTVEDMLLRVCSGQNSSYFESAKAESYYYFEETTDIQYMLFDVSGLYFGNINNLHFELLGMEPDAVVYMEEVALFTDEEAAFNYAGMEAPSKQTVKETAEPTEEMTEEATEADTKASETTPKTPATETPKSGCGSVIGFSSFAIILSAAAAFVAYKKD